MALSGKSHTEALLQHMKDQYIFDHGCSVKPQVHYYLPYSVIYLNQRGLAMSLVQFLLRLSCNIRIDVI